ncbi:MAG: Tripartite ATP-independent periplasmic transporter [Syntrophorhabdus sp. PtaU1.Bin153]|nr:MAG: Tripartite ATP-independent periplasmic transporter [Syntrophorhabdus sp. PtaU1.Bin153]
MKYLESLVNALNRISMILAGIAVLALMVLATGNVALRIFHIPYRGAYEIVSFLGALVIAGALGYTQQRKNHIVVDILTEKFPKKVHRFLDIINYGVTLVFFGIMAWQTYLFGMKIWESHEVSETLKVVFHPFIFGVSIGFALLSLNLLLDFLKALLKKGGE